MLPYLKNNYLSSLKNWVLIIPIVSEKLVLIRRTKNFYYFFFLSFFFLISCQRSSCWKDCKVETPSKGFATSSLIYDDPHNSLKLEFLKINEKISCFLNLLSPKALGEKKIIPITISQENEKIITFGYLRDGNQKIFLEEKGRDFILQGLRKNQPLTIKMDQLEEVINPELFKKKFEAFFNKSPFYKNIFYTDRV
jgi:hypothetical protein